MQIYPAAPPFRPVRVRAKRGRRQAKSKLVRPEAFTRRIRNCPVCRNPQVRRCDRSAAPANLIHRSPGNR
jgi:hypothetical protein